MEEMPCATLLMRSPVLLAPLSSQAPWLASLVPFQTSHIVSLGLDIFGDNTDQASPATAKAAVAGMLKSASVQLSASHIRVNSIAPGFVKSSITSTSANTVSGAAFDENLKKENAKEVFETVLGRHTDEKYYYNRMPEPIEIANIGVFLASDLSASVNAQNIVADSGRTAAAFGETIIAAIEPMKPLKP